MISPERVSKAKLSALRRLTQKKYRAEQKQFLVEGLHGVEEAIASSWAVESVIVTDEFVSADAHRKIVRQLGEKAIPAFSVSSREMEKLTDAVQAQGIVAVVRQPPEPQVTPDTLRSLKNIVAVEEMTEPGNLGAVIRTCDWFGVEAVLVGKKSVDLFNPKVLRTTAGSIFHVPVLTDVALRSVLEELRSMGFHLYAAVVEGGVDISRVEWKEKGIFLFGNEAHGLSSDTVALADTKILIPRIGRAESLNVGVACGIVLATVRLRSARAS